MLEDRFNKQIIQKAMSTMEQAMSGFMEKKFGATWKDSIYILWQN